MYYALVADSSSTGVGFELPEDGACAMLKTGTPVTVDGN